MTMTLNDVTFEEKGFRISTDQALLDLDVIYNYLDKESYWAQGIGFEKVKRSVANSLCFGIYKDGKLAGFSRVITDKATFAYLCDVFVLNEYRGHGLSKWMMQTICAHPDLQGLRRWSLATLDAHRLYQQFGFTPLSKPDNWMEIFTPYLKNNEENNR